MGAGRRVYRAGGLGGLIGLVRPVVEMLMGVVIPEGRHGRSIDVSRGESWWAWRLQERLAPIPSHRPPARLRHRKAVDTMARVSSAQDMTGRKLQLQLHSHDSHGVRWPLQKHKSALRFVRVVRVEHSGPARG